LDSRNASL